MQPFERDEALKYLFPNESRKALRNSLSAKIQIINQNHNLKQQFQQPVILIVDEVPTDISYLNFVFLYMFMHFRN